MKKDNVVSLGDYSGGLSHSFTNLTPEQIREQVTQNFEKSLISEDLFTFGMETCDFLEKGKRGTVGEIRTWGGNKYQKTAEGWVPVKEASDKKTTEKKEITMDNLDWGRTTSERNENLDKYNSLKTGEEKRKFVTELKNKSVKLQLDNHISDMKKLYGISSTRSDWTEKERKHAEGLEFQLKSAEKEKK